MAIFKLLDPAMSFARRLCLLASSSPPMKRCLVPCVWMLSSCIRTGDQSQGSHVPSAWHLHWRRNQKIRIMTQRLLVAHVTRRNLALGKRMGRDWLTELAGLAGRQDSPARRSLGQARILSRPYLALRQEPWLLLSWRDKGFS